MKEQWLGRGLTTLGVASARPTAFIIVLVYAASWPFVQPDTFDWHAVATLATWVMTLFIQRAEHRDTQAIHAKLDELIHASQGSRDEIADMDAAEPEAIEEARSGGGPPDPVRA